MKVIEPGYTYELTHSLDGSKEVLIFNNPTPGQKHDGTNPAEVLRALIDHTQTTQGASNGSKIVQNLRVSLAIFEAQALIQKVEGGQLRPEDVAVGKDGHFALTVNGQMP